MNTACLTCKSADMHLVVIGWVSFNVSEGIAVDCSHTVIHAVQSAGIYMVCICHRVNINICPAVCNRAAQHACSKSAGTRKAFWCSRINFSCYRAVVNKNTCLSASHKTACKGFVSCRRINVYIFKMNVWKANNLVAFGNFLISIQCACSQSEQSWGHLVCRICFCADCKASDSIVSPVEVSFERISANLSFFAVYFAVKRPAYRLPVAACQSNIRSLYEICVAPVNICIDGVWQIAKLRFIWNSVRIFSRTASACKFAWISFFIMWEISVCSFVFRFFYCSIIAFTTLCTWYSLCCNLTVLDCDFYNWFFVIVAAVPCTVAKLELRFFYLFTIRLYIVYCTVIRSECNSAVSICPVL